MSRRRTLLRSLTAAALAATVLGAPHAAAAEPADCTQDIRYDPSIPTWDQFFTAHPEYGAYVPFASGAPGRSTGANTTLNIDRYMDELLRVLDATGNTRARMVEKRLGKSELGDAGVAGRRIAFWVVGTPKHIADLDKPATGDPLTTSDQDFWSGVRNGVYSEQDGLDAVGTRPAFGWVTATPHGNEPAAGEAIVRQTYELVARTDCQNAQRLDDLDTFLMPVRNPDGRDNDDRTTAFGFDPNRDFGTRNQHQSDVFVPQMNKYPGLFYIDAHQQTSGYFFPPNEDPVLHEISDFSLNFIQNRIGPVLQQAFNDQSGQYQNYNSYDLFTPEYGDSVPSLIMGAAGMTYEKGVNESYGKQVYDHYLAMDKTINLTSAAKEDILTDWVKQWRQAREQGERCDLQPNKLVSPLHDQLTQQTRGKVCGYFFRPDRHTGDVAALMKNLQEVGVRVYRLDQDVNVGGVHEYGTGGDVEAVAPMGSAAQTLKAGTLWIPMAQSQKHWIQAVMGEDPFIPYPYYYDVVTWSYGLMRSLSGDGYLTQPMPSGLAMTEQTLGSTDLSSVPAAPAAVYAFSTDSVRGLGLAMDLLQRGVNVSRAATGFAAGGTTYPTGAALVDGTSLRAQGADLAALAKARQTPVAGLDRYPVARFLLAKPKIGLYTGAATVPSNPLTVRVNANGEPIDPAGNPVPRGGIAPGHSNAFTGQCPNGTTFCEALHTLVVKDGVPPEQIAYVTSTDLAAARTGTTGGDLMAQGFTTLINPSSTVGADAVGTPGAAKAIQDFVNAGGTYVGSGTGGITSARNAAVTNVNTQSPAIANLLTPGTLFDGAYSQTSPTTWGFDPAGWIYRDASGNPVIDPATLAATGATGTRPAIPAATAALSYGGTTATGDAPLRAYGYNVNATGDGKLDGRPAVIDQPFGSGRAVLIGFDPYYRAWQEGPERIVLNGALMPRGSAIAPSAPTRESAKEAPTLEEIAPASPPIPAAELTPPTTPRPLKAISTIDRDIRITVDRAQAARLKAAVRAAQLPRRIARHVRYKLTPKTITLVIKGVRTTNPHTREAYMNRLLSVLKARQVILRIAQV